MSSIPPHSQNFRTAVGSPDLEADGIPRDGTPIRVLVLMTVVAAMAARGLYEIGRDLLAWVGS